MIKTSPSIQLTLFRQLTIAATLIACLSGVVSFIFGYVSAMHQQDDMLMQMAHLKLNTQIVQPKIAAQTLSDDDATVFLNIIDVLPKTTMPTTGLQTIELNHTSYRAYIKPINTNQYLRVLQEIEYRNNTAIYQSLVSLLPFLLLIPCLLMLIKIVIKQTIEPIEQTALLLDNQISTELNGINVTRLPREIQPFVHSINNLLGRVRTLIQKEQQFLANAAHELRTPLTALGLQAEQFNPEELSNQAKQTLNTLKKGIDRSQNMAKQLLTFAQVQAQTTHPQTITPDEISQVLRNVLEDLLPIAESKNVKIELDIPILNSNVAINPFDFNALVKNLLENAIRYTPNQGDVSLKLIKQEQRLLLQIIDTGIGIPIELREQVFTPFFRISQQGQGSGLGLAIVQSILNQNGNTMKIQFKDEDKKTGTFIQITLKMDCSKLYYSATNKTVH